MLWLFTLHSSIFFPLLIPSFYEYKVEGLVMRIKEAEAEVARWREACELEVEAGKREIEERDKVVKKFKCFSLRIKILFKRHKHIKGTRFGF